MKRNVLSFLAYLKMLSILSISIGLVMVFAYFINHNIRTSPDYQRLVLFFTVPVIVLLLSTTGIKKLQPTRE